MSSDLKRKVDVQEFLKTICLAKYRKSGVLLGESQVRIISVTERISFLWKDDLCF